MRILLVEDDELIGDAIVNALRDAAYASDWVRDADTAMAAVLGHEHDAVLLDLNLPDGDGLNVLREIRKTDATLPVLIMTARDGVEDRIVGLDSGADDYLVKPFDLKEMLARLRAATRRLGTHRDAKMTSGKLSLDPLTHVAVYDGAASRMSSREFAVLSALLLRPGVILSRTDLEQKVYGWDEQVEGNAIEYLIHSIRKKLGVGVIRNIRGVGWMVDKDGPPGL
ncbi:Response regulator protein PmrA [Burkholderia multivorans]